MIRIGYLIFNYASGRYGNFGGELIRDIVAKTYAVENCTIDQINNYDVVLVSFPSTQQVGDYYIEAKKHGLHRRKCKIIIGGFGAQNVSLIRDYFDCVFFGRAHDVIIELIDKLLDGDYISEYSLCSDLSGVAKIRQAQLINNNNFIEEFTGCNLKCKFCHYTYARKYTGGSSSYAQTMLVGESSKEILYRDILALYKKQGRLRTAIDGFSERIRYAYGKRISNKMIIEGINHLGDLCENNIVIQDMFGGRKPETTVMTVYNICNFPGETEQDEQELIDTINCAEPKQRIIFILQSTPFRPSAATPMAWERVNLFPQWSDKRENTLVDRHNLLFKYSYTLEGSFSHLLSVLIERARYDDANIIEKSITGRGLKGDAKNKTKQMLEFDLNHYLSEHDIDAPPPVPYLESYIGMDKMRKIAKKMRHQAQQWDA